MSYRLEVSLAPVWLGSLILLLALGVVYWRHDPWAPPVMPAVRPNEPVLVPFATLPGQQRYPSFSPNGAQIAFSWNGAERGSVFDIYVQPIGKPRAARLTTGAGDKSWPVWSPGGENIAFLRQLDAVKAAICVVPAMGGPERIIAETESGYSWQGLAWSPDGKWLAASDTESPRKRPGIFLIDAGTGEKRRLTDPGEHADFDALPAFSPDGTMLAFARAAGSAASDIYVVPVAGGEPRRLTFDGVRILGLSWGADGRRIVFSSNRGGNFGLCRVPASGGEVEPLLVARSGILPSVSRAGGRLAFVDSAVNTNIWRVPLDSGGLSASGKPQPLIGSARYNGMPAFSPDGGRIAFTSDRSRSHEIWVCDANGSNATELTAFRSPHTGNPRWSPDGQWLVFDSRPEQNSSLYVMRADGGPSRRLTREPFDDAEASWSHDGRWIYFASNRSGDWQVWKIAAAGGQALQLTRQGGLAPLESPDGKYVYYAKGLHTAGLWRIPAEGGQETEVLEYPKAGYRGYVAVSARGVYLLNSDVKPYGAIQFFDFAGHARGTVLTLSNQPDYSNAALTISQDGRWLLFGQADRVIADIMLVENYR